jgi:regulatory subunit for Cdc7p protein kinase
MLTYI